jgi:hypothetical protein
MIGLQVGAVSFVDEGVEKALDTMQESAAVNTIFLATFTYGRGIAGRQVPGQPLPDHGKQEYDTKSFYGGSYTAVHPQYFKDTVFRDFRAPDFGKYDVLEDVLPAKICRTSSSSRSANFRAMRPPRSVLTTQITGTGCSAWWRTGRVLTPSMASCGDPNVRARFRMR